jgi:hypothetical protein
MNNPSRTVMIAKSSVLAKTFYRYRARMFRDHGTWPAEYPSGYLYRSVRLFPRSRTPALPGTPTPRSIIRPRRPRLFNSCGARAHSREHLPGRGKLRPFGRMQRRQAQRREEGCNGSGPRGLTLRIIFRNPQAERLERHVRPAAGSASPVARCVGHRECGPAAKRRGHCQRRRGDR